MNRVQPAEQGRCCALLCKSRWVSYGVLPQGWLFVPVVLLGAWGLWG